MLAIVTWIGAGFTLLFGFASGFFEDRDYVLFDGQVHTSFAPLWPLLCGLAVGSGAAAVGFVFRATRKNAPRHYALLAWLSGVAIPALPVLLMALNRSWQTIPVALAWLVASAMVVTYVHVRHRPPNPWMGLLLASLVAVGWIPLAYINLRVALALSGAVPVPPNDLLDLMSNNIPTEVFVGTFSMSFVAVMTAAGVAVAAHSRSALTDEGEYQKRTHGFGCFRMRRLRATRTVIGRASEARTTPSRDCNHPGRLPSNRRDKQV